MDLSNRAMVLTAARNQSDKAKVHMLRSFDPSLSHIDPLSRQASELVVPDPWGEGIESFKEVLEMIERATDGFLAKLLTAK